MFLPLSTAFRVLKSRLTCGKKKSRYLRCGIKRRFQDVSAPFVNTR